MSSENDTSADSSDVYLTKVILGVYFTSSVFTFIECLFAVYISRTNASLKRRPSKYFSYNLVLSVGLLAGISLVYGACLLFIPDSSHISTAGCFIRVVQRCLSAVSCLTLTCLALDRYVSICWPLRYYQIITEVRTLILSVGCWLAGFLLPMLPCATQLPTFCLSGASNFIFLASYAAVYNLGAFSMLVFYLLVNREFRQYPSNQRHENSALAQTEQLVRLKTARSTVRVLLLYSLLSLPHMILPLVNRMLGWSGVWFSVVYHLCHLLHRLHLLLFLPMYMWANSDSHEALLASFRTICQRLPCCCKEENVCSTCLCGFFGFLYEFFCCPSERNSRRLPLEEELSQASVLSAVTVTRAD
ncbi:adenosine receptor A3-like isoform X1 [Macrobrachium nipponense]|uniref:adenosine receptor A3-like isoform X1 n=1 Tax=Macrobrachium nipponense TaxID=159736 RepID=UPI0030C7B9EF